MCGGVDARERRQVPWNNMPILAVSAPVVDTAPDRSSLGATRGLHGSIRALSTLPEQGHQKTELYGRRKTSGGRLAFTLSSDTLTPLTGDRARKVIQTG